MIYGEQKYREMARSILPSTRRKVARDNLRAIKQRHRARVRRELRHLDEDNDLRDDFDPRSYPMEKIRFEVAERREADKLNHFETWALEVTRHISEADGRLAWMRALLPKGVIGDHAVEHLRGYPEFRVNPPWYLRSEMSRAARNAQWAAHQQVAHARRVRLLQEIVRTGWGHRMLNQSIAHTTVVWGVWTPDVPTQVPDGVHGKTKTVLRDQIVYVRKGPTSPRKLHGLGDVEDFLRDLTKATQCPGVRTGERIVERQVRRCRWGASVGDPTYVHETITYTRTNPNLHPEWLKSVDDFLDRWEAGKVQVGRRRT